MEILAERTESSQTFANPDGTQTVEQSVEPVRVRQGDTWVPVDTTLKVTSAGVVPKAAVLPMTFSGGGDSLLGKLRDGKRELGLNWPGKLPKPVLDGSTAVYREVLAGVDLRVTATATGFSEVLVVRDRKAAANPKLKALKLGLAAKGLKVSAAAGGGLVGKDPAGAQVFNAPAPLMWDSAGPVDTPAGASGGEATKKPATVQKSDQVGNERSSGKARRSVMPLRVAGNAVTITPDQKMLADPTTKYPVYIDPSVTGGLSGNAWTSVWSKYPTKSFWQNSTALTDGKLTGSAGAGRTEDCTGCSDYIVRSFFRMDTSKVVGTDVKSAEFRIEQRWAWTCNPSTNAKVWRTGTISSSTTWNNQPTWYTANTAQAKGNHKYGAIHGCLGPGTLEFDVSKLVDGSASTLTLGMKAIDEGTTSQWKRYDPSTAKLVVTYNQKPNALRDLKSDGRACATGTARPYVLWTYPVKLTGTQSDPDTSQQNLTTSFYWWARGSARSETNKVSQSNGNPGPVVGNIPSGKLVDGSTYVWQAKTSDGSLDTWSGLCEFTVDETPPPTPGVIKSTSTSYTSSTTPSGGPGITGTFSVAAPTTRPEEVLQYAWSLDSGELCTTAAKVNADATTHGGAMSVTPVKDGINTLRVWAIDRASRCSATPATYVFSVKANGPAGHWTFGEADGTTTATDISNHGNTLTLGGGATRSTGRSGDGTALSLNGTSGFAAKSTPATYPHPDTGATMTMRTDSTFTVTARVKLTATGGTGQRVAVAQGGSRTSAFTLGYSAGDNKWRFAMAGTDTDGVAYVQALSTATATAGKWVHLAGVYDSSTKKLTLYVNGVAQPTATLTGGFNAAGALTIGKSKVSGADSGFFNGDVDDVRVYAFAEAAAKLADMALPMQPAISFPNGSEAPSGGSLRVKLDAGGDTNVTKFKYSIGDTSLGNTVNAATAGGSATVDVPVGTITGDRPFYAVSVDDGARVGPWNQGQLTVFGASLSGSVLDTNWLGAAGATVTLQPGGYTTTTDAAGSYVFANLPPGNYSVSAGSGGRCGMAGNQSYLVDKQGLYLQLYLYRIKDKLGQTCIERTASFATGTTVLPLTGDDAVTTVTLPFSFPFYGSAYRTVWVDTNGVLSFANPGGSYPYLGSGDLTTMAGQNPVIAPFWDDLVVDASASVRTAVSGSGSTQQAVVEWRNVYRKGNTAQRLSFEVTLGFDGSVTTNYSGLDNATEQGDNALVGIAAPTEEDGFTYSTGDPVLANGRAIVFTRPDSAGMLEVHNLSGTLTGTDGKPIGGAVVKLDPSGFTATTAANGAYNFTGLVADSYRVTSTPGGRCALLADSQVQLDADVVRDLRLAPDYGAFGYACSIGADQYVPASTVLPVTGSQGEYNAPLNFPFPVLYHGQTYSTATVGVNGLIIMGGGPEEDSYANGPMPSTETPNAVIAPYWDQVSRLDQSTIRSELIGTAPNRSFVVEWRDVSIDYPTPSTFEVIFREDGRIVFEYASLVANGERGNAASIGLESASGSAAAVYSYNEASLTTQSSITWTPAAAGTIGGTLTTAVTGAPIADHEITLEPGGKKVTTDADGNYQFTGVPVGEYMVTAAGVGDSCSGQYASDLVQHVVRDTRTDLSLMLAGDGLGYTCTVGTGSFADGETLQTFGSTEAAEYSWRATTPFPIKLYGESYTKALVGENGAVSFRDACCVMPFNYPVPTGNPSDVQGDVFAFWDDWEGDTNSVISTKSSGTAPNRSWIVEWDNVYLDEDPSARVSFQAVFTENGEITLNYRDIDPASPAEQGSTGSIGIEDATGSIGYRYLFHRAALSEGLSVTYHPGEPGQGSVTGLVSCAGGAAEGVAVTVAGQSTTTAADGRYRFDGVPAGTWQVIATDSGQTCLGSVAQTVAVSTNAQGAADFALTARPAVGSYTMSEQPIDYTSLDDDATKLAISGDDDFMSIKLPFRVQLYGELYGSGWVDSNGYIAFADPETSKVGYSGIPTPGAESGPNAAVYPLWSDWVVDDEAAVRTATRGEAPNRQFVVEWKNVYQYGDISVRTSFQVIFNEAGGYDFVYAPGDDTFIRRGGASTIGIEDADGLIAMQYSSMQPVLRPGTGVHIESHLATAPIAAWQLDEGTGSTAADTGPTGDHPATLTGVTWSAARRAGGKAATFNGTSSYAETTLKLDTSQSFTVSAWARLTDKSADRTILTRDASGSASLYFQYQKSTDRWLAQMPSATSGSGVTWWNAYSAAAPQAGVWTHLAAVYNAGTKVLTIYVNGRAEGSVADVTPFNDPAGATWIGRGGSTWFAGDLSEVKLWDRAVDMTEVVHLARSGWGTPEVATWLIDNSTIGTYNDSIDTSHGYGSPRKQYWLDFHNAVLGQGRRADTQAAVFTKIRELSNASAVTFLPLNTTKSFTITMWTRLDKLDGDAIALQRELISQDNPSVEVRYQKSTNRWVASMASTPMGTPTWFTVTSTVAPQAGAWTELTVTYDAESKTLALYVDGKSEGSVAGVTPFTSSETYLEFCSDTPGDGYSGALDEVHMWDRALTPNEVGVLRTTD
ncbi:LamG-like jellyroll fold domain-containing protein [Actinoplanes regularis]|uniref:LamG-like jellyroll fold domain-containing protein n=1 Tax=Actinoplanes regularis TaxID=52697 RepID=UPI0015C65CAD|nr:LamG-like jellyroll fold domain-containing protein [Actinoplanes regularis]